MPAVLHGCQQGAVGGGLLEGLDCDVRIEVCDQLHCGVGRDAAPRFQCEDESGGEHGVLG